MTPHNYAKVSDKMLPVAEFHKEFLSACRAMLGLRIAVHSRSICIDVSLFRAQSCSWWFRDFKVLDIETKERVIMRAVRPFNFDVHLMAQIN